MISIVVVARNEGKWLHRTVQRYVATLPLESEVIVVDDGSTDGSTAGLASDPRVRVIRGKGAGVAQARNLGARRAKGDLLVFSDAHLELPDGWWKPLAARAGRPRVGGVAPAITSVTRPHRIGHGLYFSGADLDVRWAWREDGRVHRAPLIPWCCGMMSRAVFEASGGFDEGMTGMGSIDNEMSLRLWLLGYELWVVPSVVVAHLFRRTQPYPLTSSMQLHNRARLALVHLDLLRLARFLRLNRNDPSFGEALAAAATVDVGKRRRDVCAQRVRDTEWYFKRFGMRA